MNSVTPLNVIVEELSTAAGLFGDVAAGAGAAPLLVLMGALLIAFAAGVFGVLTLGAVASLVTPN